MNEHVYTGGTNHHPGNKRYRKMVEDRKVDYINSKRLDKPLVALEIIKEWRSQEPPGRFLKIDEKTGLWHDVGDKKARGELLFWLQVQQEVAPFFSLPSQNILRFLCLQKRQVKRCAKRLQSFESNRKSKKGPV